MTYRFICGHIDQRQCQLFLLGVGEVDSSWDPRTPMTQSCWPIALSLSSKFIGVIRQSRAVTVGYSSAQPRLFCLIRINPGKAQVCILIFSSAGRSHKMCTEVSFSAPHLHEGVFALLILLYVDYNADSPLGSFHSKKIKTGKPFWKYCFRTAQEKYAFAYFWFPTNRPVYFFTDAETNRSVEAEPIARIS